MSAIQARIHAFESLGQETPQQPAARKPPIKLYEDENNESSNNLTSHARDDDLSVGSITSDFVKVTPPRSKPPPLPPRKASNNTSSGPSTPSIEGTDITSRNTSPKAAMALPKSPSIPRPIPQRPKIVGSVPGVSNGSSSTLTVNPRTTRGHIHAPSASSFHSVSLSDHGEMDREAEHGLGGSYEAVSPHASSVFSLVERSNSITSSPATSVSNLAPALPPRPSSISPHPQHQNTLTANTFDAMSHPINVSYAVRKLPPPLQLSAAHGRSATGRDHKPIPMDDIPQRNSPRSSLASIATVTSSPSSTSFWTSSGKQSFHATSSAHNMGFNLQSLAKKRPPPLPPNAQARYDAVFDANIKAQQGRRARGDKLLKPASVSRRAVGWRGTSMDITTDDSALDKSTNPNPNLEGGLNPDDDPRLSGNVVRRIWSCSKLPKHTLKAIWDECDSMKKGSLNKQAFAIGMWRIDNELLSAASTKTPSASSFRTPPTRTSEMRR